MRPQPLFFAVALTLPLIAEANVISHTENVSILILNSERDLTCFTNDFNHEIGEVRLASSAVQQPVVLNRHEYGLDLKTNAAATCRQVKALLDDAPEGHPGTGKWLSALASSTLDFDGEKLTETVTLKVFLPTDPSRSFTFESTVIQHLAIPAIP